MKKRSTMTGQPLLDGIMMTGPRRTAMAVRREDKSIVVEELVQGRGLIFLERLPFFRGFVHFFRQIAGGTMALYRAAEMTEVTTSFEKEKEDMVPEVFEVQTEVVMDAASSQREDMEKEVKRARAAASGVAEKSEEPEAMDAFLEKKTNLFSIAAIIAGILFSVAVFLLLPRFLMDVAAFFIAKEWLGEVFVKLSLNIGEALVRILIFLFYLSFAGRIREISVLWMYHGAANKAIACYESGVPMSVENIKKCSRFHRRSGMAFLFVVVAVSILLLSVMGVFIDSYGWWVDILIRILLIFLVTGFSYELLHFAGKFDQSIFGKVVLAPGMLLQRFSSLEPRADMMELALTALEAVIPEDAGEDVW